jgi:dCTP deaminase
VIISPSINEDGMILTGKMIENEVDAGNIIIDPFDRTRLGPNSYDFLLSKKCRIYQDYILDSSKENPTEELEIGDDGIVLSPSRIYLFSTHEKMGSIKYVPIIRGRSSVGRLGIFINITSDLIDLGSINKWTLQLHSVTPVRIYAGMPIGQVTFWLTQGERTLYSGKYAKLESPVASLSYKEWEIYEDA